MLNSLNNNPEEGKLNKGVQSQEEPIIQEVYEPEPDDYNYEPQLREVDEEELRNLSAIREETQVDRRVYYVSIAFFVLALIGGGIGLIAATNAAAKADVNRKSSIARTIKNTISEKLEGFAQFDKKFKAVETGAFDETTFNAVVGKHSSFNFMLDISSEVTSEAVLLAGDPRANPLAGLREYSAHTMLLRQLLGTHVNETRADAEAIIELGAQKGSTTVMYAMQVLPDAVRYLATDAPRFAYANGALAIFTYKGVIEDDSELANEYSNLKIEQKWSEFQRMRRDYKPEGSKKGSDEEEMILPNHLLYRVLDRRGNESLLFADELVLVDRSLLFGKSANAKERYDNRNKQIRQELEKAREASANIIADLDKFIVED